MIDNDITVFAGWHKDKYIRSSCASGGIFYTVSKEVIEQGGIVIGAAFDEHFMVRHIVVDEEKALEKLKKSKYVRSNIGGLFPQVQEALENKKTVLFSGTPCQVSALKKFLTCEYENLICCSFYCYGTPEPSVYQAYLENMQKKYESPIQSIDFKDKRFGWDYYTTSVKFCNGKEHCIYGGDTYRKLMGLGYSLSNHCLTCKYSIQNTEADLILGDFYEVAKYLDIKPPHNGVSCIIAKTEKGCRLLSRADHLQLHPINSEAFLLSEKPKQRNFDLQARERFKTVLKEQGYMAACRSAGVEDRPYRLKTRLQMLRKRFGL